MLNPLCLQCLQVTTDELKTREGPHLHDHGTVGQVEKLRVLQVPQTAKSLNDPIRTQTPRRRRSSHHFRNLGPCLLACADMGRAVACHAGQPGETRRAVSIPALVTTPWARAHVDQLCALALRNRINRIRGAWLRLDRPVLYSLEWRIACQATQPTEAAASLMGDKGASNSEKRFLGERLQTGPLAALCEL